MASDIDFDGKEHIISEQWLATTTTLTQCAPCQVTVAIAATESLHCTLVIHTKLD